MDLPYREVEHEVFDGWVDGEPTYRVVKIRIRPPEPHMPEHLYPLPPGYHAVTDDDIRAMVAELRRPATTPAPGGWMPTCTSAQPLPEAEEWLPRWDEYLPGERARIYATLAILNEDFDPEHAPRYEPRQWPSTWMENWFPHEHEEE